MIDTLITGHVGSLRFARVGETMVLNISLASSRKIRDREYTDWVAGKLWGERAEKLMPHIAVGMRLLLRGRPEAHGYQKSDGSTAGELVLHIREIEFLGSKPKSYSSSPSSTENLKPQRTRTRKPA